MAMHGCELYMNVEACTSAQISLMYKDLARKIKSFNQFVCLRAAIIGCTVFTLPRLFPKYRFKCIKCTLSLLPYNGCVYMLPNNP